TDGTLMVVVNSVCGCAAGGVRPGIAMAYQHAATKPSRAITVFAGADIDATETAREYFTGYASSSPSIAFLKNGKLVKMFERRDLEGRPPQMIGQQLAAAFEEYCTKDEAAAG
ncbi:MAG: BrxA/BrxB family bacilliredoxin, partial [Pyrinomonadaceae bacterium]